MKYRILILRTFFLFVLMFSSFPFRAQSRPSRSATGPGPVFASQQGMIGSTRGEGLSSPKFSFTATSSISSIPPTSSIQGSSSSSALSRSYGSGFSADLTSSQPGSPPSLKNCPFLEGMFSPWPELYRPDITMKVWETTLVLEGTARSRSEVKADGTFGVTFDLHRIVKGEAPLLRRRKQFRLQFLDNPIAPSPIGNSFTTLPTTPHSRSNSVSLNIHNSIAQPSRNNISSNALLHAKNPNRNNRILLSPSSTQQQQSSSRNRLNQTLGASKSMIFQGKNIRPGSAPSPVVYTVGHVNRCSPPRATIKTGRKYFVFASKWENHFVAVFSPELANKKNTKLVENVLCTGCRQAPSVGATKELEWKPKERIRIRCRLRAGNPVPPLTWYKDGRPVNLADSRYRLRAKRRQSVLVIRKSRESDIGDYKCEAKNYLGSAQAITRVYAAKKTSSVHSRPGQRYPSSSSSKSIGTTPTTLWPLQSTACPFDTYCLNGGTCSYYATIGEYVCQCAEGYKGQRCDTKDIPTSGSMYLSYFCIFGPINPHYPCP